jgi:phosphoribosylanthranilate isomerase
MPSSIQVPRIKVCGLRRAEDVQVALSAGADALGFVLHPASPRAVRPVDLREITAMVPIHVPRVAVLVNTSPSSAAELLEFTALTWIQLCGDQVPQDWRDFTAPILRRIPVNAEGLQELEAWSSIATGFVLDHPSSAGGSGQQVDFGIARELCAIAPCLLAGGLDGNNVQAAITQARPHGVDASSRLEQSPGIKLAAKVQAFVHNAQSALPPLQP